MFIRHSFNREADAKTMNIERPNEKRGQLVARALEGCWRTQPPPLLLSPDELEPAAAALLSSGAGGLAWRKARNSAAASSNAGGLLREAYRRYWLQAAMHEQEIICLCGELKRAGIDAVLVKGWAAARLYPEIGVRPYGDIDICVRPSQYQSAMELLSGLERQINCDLHEGFSRLDSVATDELMARSQQAMIGEVEVRCLSDEDHLRLLCTHALRHGMWRAVWLCDIAAAVEARPAHFDWARCLGDDQRVADWVICAIALAGRLLGAEIDATPAASRLPSLPDWLISQTLKSWSLPDHRPLPQLVLSQTASACARDPRRLFAVLKERWPDPIKASIGVRASLNGRPRLLFQLEHVAARAARLMREARR